MTFSVVNEYVRLTGACILLPLVLAATNVVEVPCVDIIGGRSRYAHHVLGMLIISHEAGNTSMGRDLCVLGCDCA